MTGDALHPNSATDSIPRLHGLAALFHPRSVAVLGASSERNKIGGRPIHHLVASQFDGPVYPINPRHAKVQGFDAYPSLEAVADDVDLAIIAVPNEGVLDAVRSCAAKGVRTVVLFSAGFSEAGADGTALQDDVMAVASAARMRVLGPNCIGAANLRYGLSATFSFAVQLPKPPGPLRSIALVSQSGALGGQCVSLASSREFEFDPWVTTGNEADIDVADCVAYFAADDDVSAIAVYLEGCHDGERLKAAFAAAYAKRKPVVVLKAGRSGVGAEAAASHTASLVGSDQAYDALFRRYNACRVDSVTELVDTVHAIALGQLPAGPRTGLVTGSGGAGILMADAACGAGLDVAALPRTAQAQLKKIWPPAGVTNPIDTTAQVSNDASLLSAFLGTVLDEGDYDVIVLFLSYLGMQSPWSDNVLASLEKVRETHPDANVVVSILGSDEVMAKIRRLGIPVFEESADAVRTVARLARLHAGFARPPVLDGFGEGSVPRVPTQGQLTESSAKRILSDAGVPVVEEVVVQSAMQAADAANSLGYPVAMKVVSPDIGHKSEVGGVALGVSSRTEAAESYERIVGSVGEARPSAAIVGVLVAPMVQGGVETILGVQNDPSLGATVMFGLGGVFVEVLSDVSCRLAPFDAEQAKEMVREIKGFDILNGSRGRERCDMEALARALSSLSIFAAKNSDRIDSVDINPFIVLPEGCGGVAVDVLISPTTSA